jgi:signal transduction histidine kinase
MVLKIIQNSAHHLSNIIEDALDLTRIENHKFEVNREMFDIR